MSPVAATKTAKTTKTTEGHSAVLQRLVNKYSDGSAVALPVKAMFEDYNVRMKPFDFDRIAFFEGLYLETPDEVPPVLVEETGGKYRILDGRTRHASALNLKFKTIRAIVLKNVSET